MDRPQSSRAAGIQRHAARFRSASHSATTLVQWQARNSPKPVRLSLQKDVWPILARTGLPAHPLSCIASASIGRILTLMLVPLDNQAISPWLPATALTYFFAYACDLRRHGYRRRDILGVYALNMVLLPVVFGGVLKSLDQILRGVPTPFARTPKIAGCTGIPLRYIIAPVLLCLVSTESLIDDLSRQRIMHAAFSLWNVVMILGGCIAFMGMPTMAAELARAIRLRLRYEPWRQTPAPASVE